LSPRVGGQGVTQVEVKHDFRSARFNSPTWCGFCNRFVKEILGKQGYRCLHCSLAIHKKCLDEASKQTCLDAEGEQLPPHSSPFVEAARLLQVDFGEIIVLEELYAVLKGQSVTQRDGSVMADCFTGTTPATSRS